MSKLGDQEMKEMLKDKFENGLTSAQFEATLGDNRELHEHHYKKNDVSAHRDKLEGKLSGIKILIITEPWCGDSLAVVPTLLKTFVDMDGIEIRFVLRDQNMDVMEHYLTNGGAAIPKFIVMDGKYNELFNWGPRPKAAQDIFEEHRQAINDGKIEKADVHKKIRVFYAKDRGNAILDEFGGLLLDSI